jgi:hypothetical protein
MINTGQGVSSREVELLIRVIEKPLASHDQDALQKDVGHNLLHLFKSDFIVCLSSPIKIARYSIRTFFSTLIPSHVRDDNGRGRQGRVIEVFVVKPQSIIQGGGL